ncbi:MAG: hypothetical protein ACOX81_05045 [Candidatus Heteroscillospira sp.]
MSHRDKVIFSAATGFVLNLTYALYHSALGIYWDSLWFLILGAYYIVLSVMRFSAVLYDLRRKNSPSLSEQFLAPLLGALLILLSVILAFSVYLSFHYDVAIQYQEIMMITIATYTFYKITLAIVNAVKAHKQRSQLLIAIRNIGCADAAASLLTLQRSMLVSFEGMSTREIGIMNALTGAGVCILTASLGIYMILKKEN